MLRSALAAFALSCLTALSAWGQSYPSRPVKIVVPFPPGGSTDLMAREVAKGLTEALGQPFVVENRGGAGSTIGTAAVAKSANDGYTFLFASSHYAIVPGLYKSLAYDPVKDFTPVSLVCYVPVVLVAHPGTPYNNVRELVDYARANPGKVNYASSGAGGVAHLSAEMFNSLANVKTVHVPYKGGGPAMTDLLGGQVQIFFDGVSTSMPHIRAGTLKPLAWTGKKRVAVLPNLPTVAEQGVTGYASDAWFAMFAPAGTPRDIVDKVSREVSRIVNRPEFRAKQLELGLDMVGSTPQEMQVFLDEELAKWGKVVRDSGATAN
jgi:tripartite-type tricarboxylate transporter receptor subunit TctC